MRSCRHLSTAAVIVMGGVVSRAATLVRRRCWSAPPPALSLTAAADRLRAGRHARRLWRRLARWCSPSAPRPGRRRDRGDRPRGRPLLARRLTQRTAPTAPSAAHRRWSRLSWSPTLLHGAPRICCARSATSLLIAIPLLDRRGVHRTRVHRDILELLSTERTREEASAGGAGAAAHRARPPRRDRPHADDHQRPSRAPPPSSSTAIPRTRAARWRRSRTPAGRDRRAARGPRRARAPTTTAPLAPAPAPRPSSARSRRPCARGPVCPSSWTSTASGPSDCRTRSRSPRSASCRSRSRTRAATPPERGSRRRSRSTASASPSWSRTHGDDSTRQRRAAGRRHHGDARARGAGRRDAGRRPVDERLPGRRTATAAAAR